MGNKELSFYCYAFVAMYVLAVSAMLWLCQPSRCVLSEHVEPADSEPQETYVTPYSSCQSPRQIRYMVERQKQLDEEANNVLR